MVQVCQIPGSDRIVLGSCHQRTLGELHAFHIVLVSWQLTKTFECCQIPYTDSVISGSCDQCAVWAIQVQTGDDSVVSIEGVHTSARVPCLLSELQLKC
jgi:hypothetical protein